MPRYRYCSSCRIIDPPTRREERAMFPNYPNAKVPYDVCLECGEDTYRYHGYPRRVYEHTLPREGSRRMMTQDLSALFALCVELDKSPNAICKGPEGYYIDLRSKQHLRKVVELEAATTLEGK